MITVRITEAELANDVRSVLDRIQLGSEVIIEREDHSAIAVMRRPDPSRDIDECIRIAKQREALGGGAMPDADFAADVAAAVAAHREPLEVPEWD